MVEILSGDGKGSLATITDDDHDDQPYQVSGQDSTYYREAHVRKMPRASVGDFVRIKDGKSGAGSIAKIVRDDEDSQPYKLEGQDGYFDESEVEQAAPAVRLNCPCGDGLSEFRTPNDRYHCDFCRKRNIDSSTVMFGCRSCNHDACSACWIRSTLGDIALQADGYKGTNSSVVGIFELQAEKKHGRPTFKTPGKDSRLFYSGISWMVGDDTSKAIGSWKVVSSAFTPDEITEAWTVYDGGDWVELRGAQTVTRAAFEADFRDRVDELGDAALQVTGVLPASFTTDSVKRQRMACLGAFELMGGRSHGRPTYKQPDSDKYLFYTGNSWIIGDDVSESSGWWMATSSATTPHTISETWKVYDGKDWVEVGSAKITARAAFEAMRREILSVGDVALVAADCTKNTTCLGVFELQTEMAEERPTFKQLRGDKFLYYTESGSWMVGADISKATGWWKVTSKAMAPDAITETWETYGGSEWVEVCGAKVVLRASFEAAVRSEVAELGDIALQLTGAMPTSFNTDANKVHRLSCIGVFVLQEEMSNTRPVYKQQNSAKFLFHTGASWIVGDDVSKNSGWWQAVGSKAMTPDAIAEAWQVYDGSNWVEVPLVKVTARTVFEEMRHDILSVGDIAMQLTGTMPTSFDTEANKAHRFACLGIFELQDEMANGRPTYLIPGSKKYIFHSGANWMMGGDPGKNSGWWQAVGSKAMTPDTIAEAWQVFDGKDWITVDAVKAVMGRAWAGRPTVGDSVRIIHGDGAGSVASITNDDEDSQPYQLTGQGSSYYRESQVRKVLGDVALFAGSCSHKTECFGVFGLQTAMVHGRPSYKQPGSDRYLFHTGTNWFVGDDVSKSSGWWMVTSAATTPDAISETWKVYDGTDWVDEDDVEVVSRAQFEAHVRSETEEIGDVALQAEGCSHKVECLGVYELQGDMVNHRPCYKMAGRDKHLYHTPAGNWMVGGDPSETSGWWKVKSASVTPAHIEGAWQVYDGENWVEVDGAGIVEPDDFRSSTTAARPTRGDTVLIISGDGEGTVTTITKDDHDRAPYTLSGQDGYAAESRVRKVPAEFGRAGAGRPTVGDAVLIISGDGAGSVASITNDDHDSQPYKLSGHGGYFREARVRKTSQSRPTVGDYVLIKPGNSGAGSIGKIVQDDHDSTPYRLEGQTGDKNWYCESDVERASGTGPHTGRPTVGDRVRVKPGEPGAGSVFEITRDDKDSQPYQLKGAPQTWYREREVEWAEVGTVPTCPSGHTLVEGRRSGSGWACDQRFGAVSAHPEGCARGCTGFRQSDGWGVHTCLSCDFDLCDRCYERACASHNKHLSASQARAGTYVRICESPNLRRMRSGDFPRINWTELKAEAVGQLVRLEEFDGSDDTVKVTVPGHDTLTWLPLDSCFVDAAAGCLGEGSRVMLSAIFDDCDDASGGPLEPGDIGVILTDDGSGKPFKVQKEGGDTSWWYTKAALRLADVNVAGASLEGSAVAHQNAL